MKLLNGKKKGSTLLIAIVCGFLIIALSGTLLTSLDNELKTRRVTEERVIAKYIAEAGIEHGLYIYDQKIKTSQDASTGFPVLTTAVTTAATGTIGSYTVSFVAPTNGSTVAAFHAVGVLSSTSNRTIKMVATIDTTTGTIQSWQEE